MPSPTNRLDPLPADLTTEAFATGFQQGPVRIERIVSNGQASPDGFGYDQDEQEWGLLLEGEAAREFAGGARVRLHRRFEPPRRSAPPLLIQGGEFLQIV
jgi:cupin 2 domain-containing protein